MKRNWHEGVVIVTVTSASADWQWRLYSDQLDGYLKAEKSEGVDFVYMANASD